jgi:hypothetical protein
MAGSTPGGVAEVFTFTSVHAGNLFQQNREIACGARKNVALRNARLAKDYI